MRKWSLADYRTMPWKNGGGSTTELAIFPPDASLDNFVWRLSTAQVSGHGPFSHFAQIERSLAVLSGAGLTLHHVGTYGASHSVTLTPDSPPYSFSGEAPIQAELLDGEVHDLNMMTRRDICTHYMQRLGAGSHYVAANDAQQLLLYCAAGSATLTSGTVMQIGDLLLFDEKHEHEGILLQLTADEAAQLYLIRIQFLSMGQS